MFLQNQFLFFNICQHLILSFLSDNIFSTKSWIKNKFCFEESVINKQFEIPEDLDYLE